METRFKDEIFSYLSSRHYCNKRIMSFFISLCVLSHRGCSCFSSLLFFRDDIVITNQRSVRTT